MLPVVTHPPFIVTRLIDIANVLTRLDILYAITLLITVFMKVAIYYYVTVLGLAQTLKLRSYVPLVIPVGALAITAAANLYESDMQQVYAGMNIWPFNAFLCEVLLPVITMIVILIRRLPKEKEGGSRSCKPIEPQRKKRIGMDEVKE
jgi:spore germination protein KB